MKATAGDGGEPIVVTNPGNAPQSVVDRVERTFATSRSLEAVLEWSGAQTPPRELEEIVTQDEYTHDVVLRYDPPWYLAFDVT